MAQPQTAKRPRFHVCGMVRFEGEPIGTKAVIVDVLKIEFG